MTKGVGLVGTGTSAGEMTAISDVCEKMTDKSAGNVMAVSDVGYVLVRTGVGLVGTGTSSVDVTAMSDVG